MLITVQRDQLLQQLQVVSRAVPNRSVIASLSGILLQAAENHIYLTGNDLEISIRSRVEANITEPGEVVVPARLLTEAVRRSPTEEITLRQTGERRSIQLISGSVQLELMTLPVEDFPEQPSFAEEYHYTLPQGLIRDMIRQVEFAISTEDLRPILTGSLWSFDQQRFTMAALDGYRLASRWESFEGEQADSRAVIPAKALREIARLIPGEEEPLHVSIGSTYAAFEFSEVLLITRLLEGKFPNIEQFIPKSHQTRIVVNTQQLWDAAERAALVSTDGANATVKLTIDDDRIAISAQAVEVGRHYEEWPIQFGGEKLEIMFKVKALVDLLKSAEAEEVTLDFHGSFGPCICRPVGQDNYVSLLMPVRLS
ncbi:MAG: DNA polymerase III subunit beta [Bacillota bacterium]|jgi:DNA polymerase-3 subunit beta